jgi:primosomal protein N''
LGVEKHELLAKQAELREELQGVDSLNSVCISDIELKCMSKLDVFKKREEAERDALRQVVDTKLNQVCGQIARTENLRQDGLSQLYDKMEDFQTKQLGTVKSIREEVQENVKDVQGLFKEEMRHRMETERKMTDSVREVVKNLSQNQVAGLDQVAQRIAVLDKNLAECRKEGSERVERMSR